MYQCVAGTTGERSAHSPPKLVTGNSLPNDVFENREFGERVYSTILSLLVTALSFDCAVMCMVNNAEPIR